MANANITEASSSVVLDTRMWAGSDPNSTAWLQSPIGSNAAEGGLNLLVVDLVATAASTLTKFDLTDTGISGVDGTSVVSILGLTNTSDKAEAPTAELITGGEVHFTTASGGDTDTHRLTILYR